MRIASTSCCIVVARHGKHHNDVLLEGEADQLRQQGQRLHAEGLTPDLVAVTMTSPATRAWASLRYLEEGLGITPGREIVHPALGPLSPLGQIVREVAIKGGLPTNEAVATHHGHLAITAAGIKTPDRLIRALQMNAVWETLVRLHPGRAVVMVSHSGSRIEPAICLARETATRRGIIFREEDLPDPDHYLEEGEAALLRFKDGFLENIEYIAVP